MAIPASNSGSTSGAHELCVVARLVLVEAEVGEEAPLPVEDDEVGAGELGEQLVAVVVAQARELVVAEAGADLAALLVVEAHRRHDLAEPGGVEVGAVLAVEDEDAGTGEDHVDGVAERAEALAGLLRGGQVMALAADEHPLGGWEVVGLGDPVLEPIEQVDAAAADSLLEAAARPVAVRRVLDELGDHGLRSRDELAGRAWPLPAESLDPLADDQEAAQRRHLAHDPRVMRSVQGRRSERRDLADPLRASDLLELAGLVEPVGDRDRVDRQAFPVQRERDPVDLRVRVTVEVVCVEGGAHRFDRSRREHHRTEHMLFGLEVHRRRRDVLRGHASTSSILNGRRGGASQCSPPSPPLRSQVTHST